LLALREPDLTNFSVFVHFNIANFKSNVRSFYFITVENLLNKAEFLSRHVAYILIKNCLFIPKFNFLLRTTLFWKYYNYVNSIDSSLKSSLEKILNLRLTDLQWCQSTLPIRFGGLGIAAFPIFASLRSYLQFMVLKSLFLNY
jgi:hypothetical protein